MNTLPYGNDYKKILEAIHKALWYCFNESVKGANIDYQNKYLNKLFEKVFNLKAYHTSGLDNHIVDGLTLSYDKRLKKHLSPRIIKLLIRSFYQVQKTKSKKHSGLILPSPLQILYEVLTIPNELQTSSYSFVLCRGLLFNFLDLHPEHPDLEKSSNMNQFSEEDIFKSVSSFNNYIKQQARWPDKRSNILAFQTKVNYLSGHILSLKGFSYLWFKTAEDLKNFCIGDGAIDLKASYSNNFNGINKYNFRKSTKYVALPEISEIVNLIFGIPIPIRGADILFFGGLKKSYNGSLVISLHGEPGTGKTTTALSLAASMSPFNTNTIYISLEEDPKNLVTRLNSLIPDYLRKLSIYPNNYYEQRLKKKKSSTLKWFHPVKISSNLNVKELSNILFEIQSRIKEKEKLLDSDQIRLIPSVCPLILVIDNINELFESKLDYAELENFIENCRSLGVIVILIGADDIPNKFKLNYLVDVAIQLSQQGMEDKYEKPIRILKLLKTRLQISRQGSHVFHLSNSHGLRISPQVPSQMDKREKTRIKLPSKTVFIPTLNLQSSKQGVVYSEVLNIANNSQILIHGHGSSGKAGFGLKLLLTPTLDNSKPILSFKESKVKLRKVLIISFLYPEEYYKHLETKLSKQFAKIFDNYENHLSQTRIKAFFPGYLTPEDFVYKIVRLLEEARLEGEQFTGILLDGLHNVFLQFKNLQEAHMIWPLLYSMLSRYSISVVTTFTNFALSKTSALSPSVGNEVTNGEDFTLFQQGQKPFLHGLVKAADYFFLLEENTENNERKYKISIRSSIRITPPTSTVNWDREKLIVKKDYS